MRQGRFALLMALVPGLLAAPLVVDAQPAGKLYRIGILALSSGLIPHLNAAFLEGLRELGYVEGRNIVIERRHSDGKTDRLPDLATELIRLKVDVIVIEACGAPLNAASQKTSTIPIVVAACHDDLVASGLVASLARPGGNITGLSEVGPELAAKRLELLKKIVPKLTRVAVLWDPAYSEGFSPTLRFMLSDWKEMREAARVLGVTLQSVEIRGPDDFDSAFAAMTRQRAGGLVTFSEPVLVRHRTRIADLAAKTRLPAIYAYRELPEAGGLISYGVRLPDLYRRAAVYVDRILKGAKPADLPVEQPTTFEMVINLKTAKTLGLVIPPSVLVGADQVIQ